MFCCINIKIQGPHIVVVHNKGKDSSHSHRSYQLLLLLADCGVIQNIRKSRVKIFKLYNSSPLRSLQILLTASYVMNRDFDSMSRFDAFDPRRPVCIANANFISGMADDHQNGAAAAPQRNPPFVFGQPPQTRSSRSRTGEVEDFNLINGLNSNDGGFTMSTSGSAGLHPHQATQCPPDGKRPTVPSTKGIFNLPFVCLQIIFKDYYVFCTQLKNRLKSAALSRQNFLLGTTYSARRHQRCGSQFCTSLPPCTQQFWPL